MASTGSLSKWVIGYTAFLTLLSISTSLMGYLAPQYIFSGLDLPFDAAQPITFFYATRNVGIAVLCIAGLLLMDAKLLLAMYMLRFVVELLDLIFTLQFSIGGFNPIVLTLTWLLVFLLPELLIARYLYRKSNFR